MTEEEIQAIDAREKAATPGPWLAVAIEPNGYMLFVAGGFSHQNRRADVEFSAAARTDVPALLAEVRRLQRENEALRQMALAGAFADMK